MEAYRNKSLSLRERAEDLLSRMTLTEKIGQLNQRLYGFSCYCRRDDGFTLTEEFKEEVKRYSGLGVLYGLYRADPWSGRNYSNGIEGKAAIRVYNQAQRYVLEHSRLGIPMLLSSECPHGHQALDGYLLPVNLAMGATFHPELVRSAYEVCGRQMSGMGVDLALISVLDVLRDPRWGRSEECYSEDPFLASKMAGAAVSGCQSSNVAVVAKHFCAQGEGTGGINASAARIGERELREIHLPPAKECVRAGVKAIMAAYNEIDGIPCHANKALLTDLLRREMGFQGIIMADGMAIDCLNIITGASEHSAALALRAGVDVSLWDTGYTRLEEAVKASLIGMEELNEAVRRVLELKFERGLFEQPYMEEPPEESESFSYSNYPQSLELARESVVMLENRNNILPLSPDKISSIAVIGPNADDLYNQLGDYSPPVREKSGITVLQGIKELVGDNLAIEYRRGCTLSVEENIPDREEVSLERGTGYDISARAEIEQAAQAAGSIDLTVLVLGGSSSRFSGASFDVNGAVRTDGKVRMDCGEGVDSATLELPGYQKELAEAVFRTGKPVITVLIQGRPYAVPEIAHKSQALLCAFYPGMLGGQAIAEVLFGKTAPSGRLPVSIPYHAGQLPVYYNYKASYAAMNYYNMEKRPLYPFGYGLTYSRLLYQEAALSRTVISIPELEKEEINISFHIRNEGSYDTYGVPQLYIRDLQSSTVRRIRELKAFAKIMVPAGSSREVSFRIGKEELSVWDIDMNFKPEKGEMELFLCDMGIEYWSGRIVLI